MAALDPYVGGSVGRGGLGAFNPRRTSFGAVDPGYGPGGYAGLVGAPPPYGVDPSAPNVAVDPVNSPYFGGSVGRGGLGAFNAPRVAPVFGHPGHPGFTAPRPGGPRGRSFTGVPIPRYDLGDFLRRYGFGGGSASYSPARPVNPIAALFAHLAQRPYPGA